MKMTTTTGKSNLTTLVSLEEGVRGVNPFIGVKVKYGKKVN